MSRELQGRGSAYASLSFDTWTSTEDPAPTENWLAVEREYLRLKPVRTLGGAVLLRVGAAKVMTRPALVRYIVGQVRAL